MNVSIEVKPSVEVILEARDGIVAEYDVVFAIFDFEIVAYLGEALQQTSVVATVVVALDEDDVAVESFEYIDCGRHVAPEHVTEDVDGIAGVDSGVPTANKFFVVFGNRLKWAIVEV